MATNFKHGLCDHVLYGRWRTIKKKCYRPKATNYKYYGAKGITMHEEWITDFKAFYDWCMTNGWKKELEICRIGDKGNYEPNNIIFQTPQRNHLDLIERQYKGIRVIETGKEFKCLQDAAKWIKESGKSKGTIKTIVFNIKRIANKTGYHTSYGYKWEWIDNT